MTLTTIDHTRFIDRIYDILTADKAFADIYKDNVIKGQAPNQRTGGETTDMPWVNIIESDNPVVSKRPVARGNPPKYLLTLEYWIVVHARGENSKEVHNTLTDYATQIESIFQAHPQLAIIVNDLDVRLCTTRPVTKLVAPLGATVQARNVMLTVEAYYQPVNTPRNIGQLVGERSHTIDPVAALAIINDGNDGSQSTPPPSPVSLDNLNDGDKNTWVEIPAGETLSFTDGGGAFDIHNIWAFFSGQPGAKLVIRLKNTDGTDSFVSNEVSPDADNNAVLSGTTVGTTSRATQSVTNTGTETAYYAGWSGSNTGTIPPSTTVRVFTNGTITNPPITRPFTSITLPFLETLELGYSGVFDNNDTLKIYFEKETDTELELTMTLLSENITEEYVFKKRPIDGVITIPNPTAQSSVTQITLLKIKPLSITGSQTIQVAGTRILNYNGEELNKWQSAVAVTKSVFPFDHDVNTSVGLAVGTYFFNQTGGKELESVIISSMGPDPISVTVSTSKDGVNFTQQGIVEALVETPTEYKFGTVFQEFAFVRLLSTKTFRLHELSVLGLIN